MLREVPGKPYPVMKPLGNFLTVNVVVREIKITRINVLSSSIRDADVLIVSGCCSKALFLLFSVFTLSLQCPRSFLFIIIQTCLGYIFSLLHNRAEKWASPTCQTPDLKPDRHSRQFKINPALHLFIYLHP